MIFDPQVFRPNSTLGCHGLMEAYRAGNVAICNAVGTGVADDKSVYPYVPEMIRFYLGRGTHPEERAHLDVPQADDLQYVLANLKDLVVKEVHGAGGYGMLIGPPPRRPRSKTSAARCWPTRRATSPSPRSACRAAPPMWKAALPRATSTCALCAERPRSADGGRRPDPRGLARGLAGGQFIARAAAPKTPGCWEMED